MPNSLFRDDLRGEYDARVLDVRERQAKARQLQRALAVAGLWHSPAKILDVGCGSGLILAALDAPNALRVGCDLRAEPFQRARAHRRTAVAFVQSDARDLPFHSAKFDLVICLAVIEELPDWRESIRAMVNCVAPDGVLYLTITNGKFLVPLFRLARLLGITIKESTRRYAELSLRFFDIEAAKGFGLDMLCGWQYVDVTPQLARAHQPLLRVLPIAWLSWLLDWIAPSFAYAWQRPHEDCA